VTHQDQFILAHLPGIAASEISIEIRLATAGDSTADIVIAQRGDLPPGPDLTSSLSAAAAHRQRARVWIWIGPVRWRN
jgi:hypothetical protein